jgi:putative ABC transport system permease protein
LNLWYGFGIALHALAINKGRTALTALGVIIGVAAVIAMVGLGQGFGNAITSEINASGANWIYIMPGREAFGPAALLSRGRLTLADGDAIQRRFPDTIRKVVPVVMGQATVKYGNKSTLANFAGGTPDYLRLENLSLRSGSVFRQADIDGRVKTVVVGTTVIKELTGSSTTNLIGKTILINRQAFTVRGLLRTKGISFGYDPDNLVIMPYTTAMRRMMNTDNLTYLAVQAVDEASVPRVEDEVRRTLRHLHSIRPPYNENDDFSIMTQEGARAMVSNVTRIISLLLASIAAISLLVGSIGIMNIMLVSVTERTREIGLRKAVGASTNNILVQFLIEAVVISVLGGLVGIIIGLLGTGGIAWAVNTYTSVKVIYVINPIAIILAFGVSATIGILAGLYPALRAARMDPIIALRYE